jgi:tRNA1Val (adenine37-N6)-methyltransferase
MDEETLDEILNGLVRVYQKKKGYRFSIDSILLSHFVSLKKRSRFMEIGCGSGVILLILAKRFSDTTCAGLEVQESLAKLACKNVEFNDLGNRIQILRGDARHIKNIFQERSFDSVIFNPPYRKLNSGRVNPLPEKAIARHEITGSLDYFLKASRYLLKPGGTVFTIFPAKRLVELIHLFRKNGIEPKRMRLVFSDRISEAEFTMIEGRMGGREELKVQPSLFIYNDCKKYSDDMLNIFSELSVLPTDGDG